MGDYFRWSYKPGSRRLQAHMPYWCCSRIALVEPEDRLRDTYWSGGADGKQWTREQAEEDLVLEFVANVDDLDVLSERARPADRAHAQDTYRAEDLVDLSHPNGGTIYMRKGAKPCHYVRRAALVRDRDAAQRNADCYQRQIDRLDAEAGNRE